MKLKVNFRGEVILDMSAMGFLDKVLVVSRESGYGKDAKYTPADDPFDMEVINESQIITSEEETLELLKKKAKELETQKSAEWLKAYNAQQKVDALTKELAAIKSVCPHNDPISETPSTPSTPIPDTEVPF